MLDGDGGGSGGGSGAGGTGGEGGGSGGEGGGTGAGGEGAGGAATFTQADLDRHAGTARQEARRAAERQIADQLGCTPEEAKALIDAKKQADSEAMSEAEKREKAADAKEKTAVERENAAKLAERRAAVMVALVSEGVKFEQNDDGSLKGKGARIMQLVNADLDVDADPAAIATAVASVKADTPELFAAPTEPQLGPDGKPIAAPPSGDLGPDGKPKVQASTTELERGKERAQKVNEAEKPFDLAALRGGG